MVPIPLRHHNQSLRSPPQSRMQGYYWVPLFHPLLPTPAWGPTPSSKANFRTSGPFLLRTCSASPPRLLQPQCPGKKERALSIKGETLLEIILFFGHTITPIPTWDSDHVPPFYPLECNPLYCFPLQSRLHRQQYSPTTFCFKQTILPPPFWYPSPSFFGPGGAGVYVTCSKCHTTNTLFFSSSPIASRITAETFALKQGLDWCTNHLLTCKFQSVLFLTDSQSALSILSSAPSYLLPKSLWNVWSLASSLSNNITLNFHWVPGHAGLLDNKNADLLAKAGASLPTDAIQCPLPPVIAKIRYLQYHNWRRPISHSYLNYQVPKVSLEELLLSRSVRCELSRLRCHGHNLLLSSYFHRISRKENSACSACGHPLQALNHLLLDCPASEPLRKSIFGFSLSILALWSRPWSVARLLSLRGVPPRSHPSEGVG